jgi:hypothetical protein
MSECNVKPRATSGWLLARKNNLIAGPPWKSATGSLAHDEHVTECSELKLRALWWGSDSPELALLLAGRLCPNPVWACYTQYVRAG